MLIANTKKYLQFDWLRGVQYWQIRKNKKYNIRFLQQKYRNVVIKNKLVVNH